MALHAADRRLRVRIRPGGTVTEFALMIREPNQGAARQYADVLLAEAASVGAISQEDLGRAKVTQVVSRWSARTGAPRPVEAPAGRYRTVDLGDRGWLCAMHEGPLGDWVVYPDPDKDRGWAGRDLFAVLSELFELPHVHGPKEAWVHGVIENLAGRKTPLGVRYPCPCCDYLTFTRAPSGSDATCPVCQWEDDIIQLRDLDYSDGPNRTSLREARASFRRMGVSQPRRLKHARPSLPEEKP